MSCVRPVHGLAPAIEVHQCFRLLRIGRRGDFLPLLFALVAAVQLDAEVAMVEGGIISAIARVAQREGDIVAEEMGRPSPAQPRLPFADFEQSLAGRNHD